MANFEFKSQICTTKPQSEKLLALGLKKETADCALHYDYVGIDGVVHHMAYEIGHKCCGIPAWSLHRLINLLPVEVTHNGYKFQLRKDVLSKIDDIDNVYDEVIGVIHRAIELDSFNKDYLEEK